ELLRKRGDVLGQSLATEPCHESLDEGGEGVLVVLVGTSPARLFLRLASCLHHVGLDAFAECAIDTAGRPCAEHGLVEEALHVCRRSDRLLVLRNFVLPVIALTHPAAQAA